MHAFDYVAPGNLIEALSRLATPNRSAKVLSGGTDLLAQLKEGKGAPSLIVDIKRIAELNELTCDAERGLTLGAGVPCHRLNGNGAVKALYPALLDSSSLIGGTQIQGRATFGGNLCNASPAADAIPNLIVHDAECRVAGAAGERTVPVADFCTAPGRTVLEPSELLVSLHLPAPPAGFGASYLRFIPRNEMDIAVVGVGVSVELDGDDVIRQGRVALGAVAPTPLPVPEAGEAMAGQKASPRLIARVAQLATAAARPIADMRGTIAQRKHLVGVLTRRALIQALARAR